MTKRERKDYAVTHKLAKAIAALINTILFCLILDLDHYILFGIVNFTYFFGVNTISALIEKAAHMRRRHDWI